MKQLFAASFSKLVTGGMLVISFAGCSVLDPAEDIPSYLHIDSMSLSTTSIVQQSSSAKITDAWVFMDNELLGAFELPCNIPILAEGTHSFHIRGGVKMNGLVSTRAIYTAWKQWEGNVTLTRGEKAYITPVVTYFPGIDFGNTWMLNFDLQGTSLIPEATSSGIIVKDTIPYAYEGPHSGYVHLNNNDTTFFFGTSADGYIMPPNLDTWIEFDYRSDAPFTVGIKADGGPPYSVPWIEVQPNLAWTKIYIRLTEPLSRAATENFTYTPATTPYKIYFAMINPSSQAESHLYIDNIKLLK
jgi:hypothetical protein